MFFSSSETGRLLLAGVRSQPVTLMHLAAMLRRENLRGERRPHETAARFQGLRLSFLGARWRNCGADPAQTQLANEQATFYQELTKAYSTVFPEQQAILNALTKEFQPILAAGPNQAGFNPAEEAALRTEASDTTTRGAQQADVALGAKLAAEGDATIPSGAKTQLEAGLTESANAENAGLQNKITEENYATGRENFLNAASALESSAGLLNPNAAAGSANQGGSAANTTFNDIAAENSAWMGPVFGMIGGLGGAALGNPSLFGGGGGG